MQGHASPTVSPVTMSRTISLLSASIGLAAALALGTLVPAHASSTTKTDPEDDVFLAELGGGIDLAAVSLATRNRKKRVRVTFRLHEPVPLLGSLAAPGGLSVQFVTDRRSSRVVTIFTDREVLRGSFCHVSTDDNRGRECRRLPVVKVDDTTYRTVVGLPRIEKDATVLRWTASSLDISNGDPVIDSLTAGNGKPFRWRL